MEFDNEGGLLDTILKRHKRQGLLIAVLCTLLLSLPPVFSQDATHILLSGETTTGTVDADTTATSYVFDATAGTTANIIVTNDSEQPLGILLSDPDGEPISQEVDKESVGTLVIQDALLPSNGRYFIVVYLASQTETVIATDFDLTVSFNDVIEPTETPVATLVPAPTATAVASTVAIPDQILIASGIEVTLSWTGAADMNLQVRDPIGGTLYWDSRATTNGGTFGFDANGLCEVISDNPVETARWAPGFLPTGSYEILIFYKQACEATVGSVPFTVSVTVDGVVSDPIDGVLLPPIQDQDSVYLSRFVIDGDGTATVSSGSAYPDSSINNLPNGFDIATTPSIAIDRNVPAIGDITNDQPYSAYSFIGAAGEIVSIDLQAQTASLDTLVQVVDSTGAILLNGVNDDSGGSTDSFISNYRITLW